MITLKKQAWWEKDNQCCQAVSALWERWAGPKSQGSGAVHEAFYKLQQHKNIKGEEQACGAPVGRNPVL